MKIDRVYANELLDTYGFMLTQRQLDILKQYLEEDYSLSEISENEDISRSAVSESINKSLNVLQEFEKQLSLLKIKNNLHEIVEKMASENSIVVNKYVNELKKLEEEI